MIPSFCLGLVGLVPGEAFSFLSPNQRAWINAPELALATAAREHAAAQVRLAPARGHVDGANLATGSGCLGMPASHTLNDLAVDGERDRLKLALGPALGFGGPLWDTFCPIAGHVSIYC